MKQRCPRTAELLAALAAGADAEDAIWHHLGECDACARAIGRALLAADAPDADDVALSVAGLADDATAARVERAVGLDLAFAQRIEKLSAAPARPRRLRAWTFAMAASALLAVGLGAAWILRDPEADPVRPKLVARGGSTEVEVELVLGDHRICRTATPGSAPCVWAPEREALGVHYRSPEAVHAAVFIHDADGDWTALHPEGGGTAELPACTGRFCPLLGGEFNVPAGLAELVVLLFDKALPADVVISALPRDGARAFVAPEMADVVFSDAPTEVAQRSTTHRFALRVE